MVHFPVDNLEQEFFEWQKFLQNTFKGDCTFGKPLPSWYLLVQSQQ